MKGKDEIRDSIRRFLLNEKASEIHIKAEGIESKGDIVQVSDDDKGLLMRTNDVDASRLAKGKEAEIMLQGKNLNATIKHKGKGKSINTWLDETWSP